MIGQLNGTIKDKTVEGVLIDVHGVGYEVALPLSTLANLPATGEPATLFIHTHVREDDLKLFGFADRQDRLAFRTLLKISGVGPKLALAVLGALSGPELARVVGTSDVKRLSAIPGIGKKTAERMLLELGGKLKLESPGAETVPQNDVYHELNSALKNLGFKPAQVDRVLGELRRVSEPTQPFEKLLRQALALLQEKF